MKYKIIPNQKPTLVLLHGFLESSEIWREMIPFLKKYFQLLLLDFPGHGQSPWKREATSLEEIAQELNEILEKENITKVHLLGHSMGGYVALSFAEKFPEKLLSLSLFFSTFEKDSAVKVEGRKKAISLIGQDFGKFVQGAVPSLFGDNTKESFPEKIEFAKNIAKTTNPKAAIAFSEAMMKRKDMQSVLSNLPCKTILFLGRYDKAVLAGATLDLYPTSKNAKAYVLDSGHHGQLECPLVCSAILLEELA